VISPHVRIDSFDPGEWRRLRRLFHPGGRRGPTPPLLLLLDEGRPVKALRPGAPAEDAEEDLARLPWHGTASLPQLRHLCGARLAAALDVAAIDRIAVAVDTGVDPRQDLVEQGLVFARAVRAEVGRGLHLDPAMAGRLPLPSFAALQQTFDALLPDDRAAALFVFEEGPAGHAHLHASAVVEKRGGHVVRVTSHRALGAIAPGFLGGRHRRYLDAIERRIARPHVALFCTRDAWREIAGPASGALARQVALRGAVIDPVPPWLLAMTSIGVAASMAQGASRLFGRFVPQGIKDTARSLAASPFAALGFDPFELVAQLRKLL
jgi:hypothetical protein